MNKNNIPCDQILQDGENYLHSKVEKDTKFRKYFQEMNRLVDETIKNNTLKARISEAYRLVYIFAELAAYKIGFKKGIRFLINAPGTTDESAKPSKRESDFYEAFERFLA